MALPLMSTVCRRIVHSRTRTPSVMFRCFWVICSLLRANAFQTWCNPTYTRHVKHTVVNLVPLAKFREELTFFDKPPNHRGCIGKDGSFEAGEDSYYVAIAEEADLPDISRFVVTSFGADAINLSQDLNTFESMLMRPAVELVNGYSGIVAFAEVLAGLRSRLKDRLTEAASIDAPRIGKDLRREDKIALAARNSLVLALARTHKGSDWHIDVIGSVELRLETSDAKIPFSLPWLDRIERRLASLIGLGKNHARDLQPYLSNLCVAENYRGKGIGRALVKVVEDIVAEKWNGRRVYLHVDVDNKAALKLYKTEGYNDVGLRWKPFWAGKAADIGYFVKKLDGASAEKTKSGSGASVKSKE